MNDGAMRAARRIMDGLDWRCLDGGRKIARDRIVIGVEELAELIREEYYSIQDSSYIIPACGHCGKELYKGGYFIDKGKLVCEDCALRAEREVSDDD